MSTRAVISTWSTQRLIEHVCGVIALDADSSQRPWALDTMLSVRRFEDDWLQALMSIVELFTGTEHSVKVQAIADELIDRQFAQVEAAAPEAM